MERNYKTFNKGRKGGGAGDAYEWKSIQCSWIKCQNVIFPYLIQLKIKVIGFFIKLNKLILKFIK